MCNTQCVIHSVQYTLCIAQVCVLHKPSILSTQLNGRLEMEQIGANSVISITDYVHAISGNNNSYIMFLEVEVRNPFEEEE